MGQFDCTRISLNLSGDDLDRDEITRLLGKRPDRAGRKGDKRVDRKGKPIGVVERGYWQTRIAERRPGDLDGQIRDLLSEFNAEIEIWRRLTSRFDANLFCGLFMGDMNDGAILSPDTMNAISARGLELHLDVYDSGRTVERWRDGEFVGNGSDYD